MKLYKLLSLIILIITLSGCNRERFYICSKDKKQCITVITYKDAKIRYIINGKHYTIPDKNYIKVDISKIDPIGDGIWGCWEGINGGWECVVEKAVIIESKLDTTKFRFSNELPRDEWGVPREIKYRGKNCFIFDYLTKEIEGESYVE